MSPKESITFGRGFLEVNDLVRNKVLEKSFDNYLTVSGRLTSDATGTGSGAGVN